MAQPSICFTMHLTIYLLTLNYGVEMVKSNWQNILLNLEGSYKIQQKTLIQNVPKKWQYAFSPNFQLKWKDI